MPHMKNTSHISFITCTCHTCDKCKRYNKCHRCHRCQKCHLYDICYNCGPHFLHQFRYGIFSLCLLFSLVIVPASLIQSFVPQVLQSWKLFYLSLAYSSVFSVGFGLVVTYSPSSILPWKQLALSLVENILYLYFSL